MADEKATEKKADDAEQPKGGIKGLLTKLPVLLGGVMVIEAVALFAGFKMLGGGPAEAEAHAGEAHVEYDDHGNPIATGDAALTHDELAEVVVGSFRSPNRLNGRTYVYHLEISVRVKGDVKEQVEATLASSTALVKDRMNRIVASIDPQKLNGAAEPGLETLRRQVKYQLDLIVGDGLIEEVLVPQCIPYRADY